MRYRYKLWKFKLTPDVKDIWPFMKHLAYIRYGITATDLLPTGKRMPYRISYVKQLLTYYCLTELDYGYTEVSRMLNQHHASSIHSFNVFESFLKSDQSTKEYGNVRKDYHEFKLQLNKLIRAAWEQRHNFHIKSNEYETKPAYSNSLRE